jgi:hypothetical protein
MRCRFVYRQPIKKWRLFPHLQAKPLARPINWIMPASSSDHASARQDRAHTTAMRQLSMHIGWDEIHAYFLYIPMQGFHSAYGDAL